MWKVDKKGNIKMTRGDTPRFTVTIMTVDEDGNKIPYTPSGDDRVVFAMKEPEGDSAVCVIEVPNDTLTITFKESDTAGLDIGMYDYEVSLNSESRAYHDTFIQDVYLELTTEVN